jgi:hypothetical protein
MKDEPIGITTRWTVKKSVFDSRQEQEILLVPTASSFEVHPDSY